VELSLFDTKTKGNTGVAIELLSLQTGRKSGATITVHGRDSDVYVQCLEERARQLMERAERKEPALTSDERIEMGCELLARNTIGWEGLTENGEPIPFSYSRAFALYKMYPAIRRQIDAAIEDDKNFVMA
jgi:hypothetical protein